MNKIIILSLMVFFSSKCFCQFNTLYSKKEVSVVEDVQTPAVEKNTSFDVEATKSNKLKKLFNTRLNYSLPVDSLKYTSNYGYRLDPFNLRKKWHGGVDIRARNHAKIYAIMPGVVTKKGYDKKLGNYIEIAHSGNFKSMYGHMYKFLVDLQQKIEAGQAIGLSGSTGRAKGEHLHFSLKHLDKKIDPKPILNFIQTLSDFSKNELSKELKKELKKTKN